MNKKNQIFEWISVAGEGHKVHSPSANRKPVLFHKEAEESKMQGIIAFFHPVRNFGFIQAADGNDDVFFHGSEFKEKCVPPLGVRVEFDVSQPIRLGKRPQAVNVRFVKGCAEPQDTSKEEKNELRAS
jgi:cold shock CspA family protein